MHRICHTPRMSPSVTSGGTTRTAICPSAGPNRALMKFGLRASKRRTSAVAGGSDVAEAVLRAGMVMRAVSIAEQDGGRLQAGGPRHHTSTRLIDRLLR
jgi:hypothetical protein